MLLQQQALAVTFLAVQLQRLETLWLNLIRRGIVLPRHLPTRSFLIAYFIARLLLSGVYSSKLFAEKGLLLGGIHWLWHAPGATTVRLAVRKEPVQNAVSTRFY